MITTLFKHLPFATSLDWKLEVSLKKHTYKLSKRMLHYIKGSLVQRLTSPRAHQSKGWLVGGDTSGHSPRVHKSEGSIVRGFYGGH